MMGEDGAHGDRNYKGNVIGRSDAEAEAPILWT